MNWIKKNWLSLIAITLSITAWFKFERIEITSHSIEWCFPIGIAVISLGTAVALGMQIWYAVSIEAKIKREVKAAKDGIEESFENEREEIRQLLSIVNDMAQGRVDLTEMQYRDAFICFMRAIRKAHEIEENGIVDACIGVISSIVLHFKKKKEPLPMIEEERKEWIDVLRKLDNDSAFGLAKIISESHIYAIHSSTERFA